MIHTLESGSFAVVVHKVLHALFREPHLPAQWEGKLLGHGASWVLPLCRLALVVHKVNTRVGEHAFLCVGGERKEGRGGREGRGRKGMGREEVGRGGREGRGRKGMGRRKWGEGERDRSLF